MFFDQASHSFCMNVEPKKPCCVAVPEGPTDSLEGYFYLYQMLHNNESLVDLAKTRTLDTGFSRVDWRLVNSILRAKCFCQGPCVHMFQHFLRQQIGQQLQGHRVRGRRKGNVYVKGLDKLLEHEPERTSRPLT